MKRVFMITLLLLSCLACARAEGNLLLPLPEDEWIDGLFTDGETLYIAGSRLYAWRAGDAEPSSWEDRIDLPGPEDGEDFGWRYGLDGVTLFADGEALRGGRLLTDGNGEVQALQLCDIAFTDDGAVEARNLRTLDAPASVRDSGLNSLSTLCVGDGALYLLGQGEGGATLCVVDGENPKAARAEALGWNDFHLLPAPDGPVLAEEDYGEGTKLSRVGRDGSLEALCTLPPFATGMAADPVSGAIYAALDGRVRPVDLDSGELGEPVSALPLRAQGAAALKGRYCAWMGNHVAVMDAGNRLDEDGVLSYSSSLSGQWMEEVLLRFAVSHPELAVARAEVPAEDVLDGMLTQSRDVDVHIMDSRDGAAAYEALLERGYMLPLDGREALRDFYGRMYPGIQRRTARDGAFCALPVYVRGSGMGVSEAMLARLGLSLSDVPDNWTDFLAFLEDEVRPRLADLGPDGLFTYRDLDAGDFQYYLRMGILGDWVNNAAAAGVVPDYEDPRLIALLERVDATDYTAYGLPEPSDDAGDEWGGHGYSYGGGDHVLIQFGTDYDLDEYDMEGTPLLLGFGDDLPGTMPLNLIAAFVNPYSAHPEAALDLVETLLESLPVETQYMLCPDLNEPLVRPDYEQGLARYDGMIEQLRAQLEAAEPKDRQALEEELAVLEGARENSEADRWLIPPEKLAWYRAHGDRVTAAAPDWFGRDTSGEAWQLLEQYDAGLIPAREFLAAVNRRARMMALEGD